MSERKDILDGLDEDNWKSNRGLIYTCRAGWIDLGHLNPHNARPEIGAANLWKNIRIGGKTYTPPYHDPYGYSRRINKLKGFLVYYRQDHANRPGKPGIGKTYLVKHGLSNAQKKRVALSIFMDVSKSFETLQARMSFMTDSGFSQEDLVSNLIGFYIGIGEISRRRALEICHPVSKQAALSIWDREGAVGQNKNRTWQPQYPDSTVHATEQYCRDECLYVEKSFPKEFQTIKPIRQGILHEELIPGAVRLFAF